MTKAVVVLMTAAAIAASPGQSDRRPPETVPIVPQSGPERFIGPMAFSPDGSLLATAGAGSLQLWEVATGHLVNELRVGQTSSQRPGGGILDPQSIRTQEGPGLVGFSPDGEFVMWTSVRAREVLNFGTWNSLPHVWALRTGEFVSGRAPWNAQADQAPWTLERFRWNSVQVGLWAAVGSDAVLDPLKDYAGPALALTRDGRLGVSREGPREARTISLWDLRSRQKVRTFEGAWRDVLGLAISPSGRWVAMHANLQRELIVWDASTGARAASLPLSERPDNFGPVAFSPDERWVAVRRQDNIALFETGTWKAAPSATPPHTLDGHRFVGEYAFSPDGRLVAFRVSDYGRLSIVLWDVAEARVVRTIAEPMLLQVTALAVSPDATTLVVGASSEVGRTGALVIWDLASGTAPHAVEFNDPVRAVAFSQDGRRLAVGTRGESRDGVGHLVYEGQTLLYDVLGWRQTRALDHESLFAGSSASSQAVAFSPDGTRVASALLDIEKYQQCDPGEPCGFEPIPYIGLLTIWDSAAGTLKRRLRLPDEELNTLAFSPNGRFVATGHQDRLVKIYDARSGRRVRLFGGFSEKERPFGVYGTSYSTRSLAFSARGDRLVSGTADGTVTVWNPATGARIVALRESGPGVSAVAFSGDQRSAVAADCGGQVTGWDLRTPNTARPIATHMRCATALATSASRPSLVFTGGEEGTVTIADVVTGRVYAHLLYGVEPGAWLVTTPEGLFDGSSRGVASLAAWRHGLRTYTPAQLPQSFRVPGLLQKVLAGSAPTAPAELSTIFQRMER